MQLPSISELINVSLANISLQFDDIVDNGEWFSLKNAKEAIDLLLIAGGAYAFVDKSGNYVVRPRARPDNIPVKTFYAAHDERRLSPIVLAAKAINTGANRIFNRAEVNGRVSVDQISIDHYGLKDRGEISMPFITSEDTAFAVAENLTHEFGRAKAEMVINVLAADVQNLEVGDVVRLDIKRFSYSATKLPDLYGQAEYGEAVYAHEQGQEVTRNIVWTIYDKTEEPEKLTAALKLRRYGREVGDDLILEDVYGEALYDQSRYSALGIRYDEALYDQDFYS